MGIGDRFSPHRSSEFEFGTKEEELWERYGVVPQGRPVTEGKATGEGLNVSFRQVERDMVSSADILHQPKAEMVDGELETPRLHRLGPSRVLARDDLRYAASHDAARPFSR